MFFFCTPKKRRKTKGYLTFLKGIEMEHWAKIGQRYRSSVFVVDLEQVFYNSRAFNRKVLIQNKQWKQ